MAYSADAVYCHMKGKFPFKRKILTKNLFKQTRRTGNQGGSVSTGLLLEFSLVSCLVTDCLVLLLQLTTVSHETQFMLALARAMSLIICINVTLE